MKTVVSQHGRPDDGTDSTGFFNAEFFVPLKPFDTWPPRLDKDKLTEEMSDAADDKFPGVDFNFSQNIEDNVEEAASGVKGENSVKLYGNDLEMLDRHGRQDQGRDGAQCPASRIWRCSIRWASRPCRSTSTAPRPARYGLAPGDINTTVQAAIGGQAAGDLYEDGQRPQFPDHGAPGAGIPSKPGRDPRNHHRRAQSERTASSRCR